MRLMAMMVLAPEMALRAACSTALISFSRSFSGFASSWSASACPAPAPAITAAAKASTASSALCVCCCTSCKRLRAISRSATSFASAFAPSRRPCAALARSCKRWNSSSVSLCALCCTSKKRRTPRTAIVPKLQAAATALLVGGADSPSPSSPCSPSLGATPCNRLNKTKASSIFSSACATLPAASSKLLFIAICFSTAGGRVRKGAILFCALWSRCCTRASSATSLVFSVFCFASICRWVRSACADRMCVWASR
mmetsp:Transcript_87702/g.252919  ORF Transcript_87702/g.252919 Transcript_87702/m.252919 type:complete len:255 (+) Transcript_87702:166-930(+)